MVDEVIPGKTRNRRKYASYYTESKEILGYMLERLRPEAGSKVLEPSAGNGAFLAALLEFQQNLEIDAVDLNPVAVQELKKSFDDARVDIREADTLLDPLFDEYSHCGGHYDSVIANPPYGAWQDPMKRSLLKEKFGLYAKETYALFLVRCLSLLKPGGRLTFIMPDTFLAVNMHKELRRRLLEGSFIEEIALFPSDFFPGVNFGYSNLCILTVTKKAVKNDRIRVLSFADSPLQFVGLASENPDPAVRISFLNQFDISSNNSYNFYVDTDQTLMRIIEDAPMTLGEIADCVTGFYSGDNSRFLKVSSHESARSRKYGLVNRELIKSPTQDDTESIRDRGYLTEAYIPIHKGGKGHYVQPTEWYIAWSERDVYHYRTDKRARFQNSRYYFRDGLAVPMVRGKRLKATRLEGRLFEQSVVGVFPHDPKDQDFLLAFLNSKVATVLIGSINHTANNSANYLKRLPIVISDSVRSEVNEILAKHGYIFEASNLADELDNYFSKLYDVPID